VRTGALPPSPQLLSADLHSTLVAIELGLAVVTFALLGLTTAPYGRHGRPGWGPTIPARVGWIVMESPALLAFGAFYLRGAHRFELAPLLLAMLWGAHYVNRVLVYPFRIRPDARRMPVLIAMLAIAFNLLNASVNAPQLSTFGNYSTNWLTDPRFLGGSAMFIVGMIINVRADARLFALRSHGQRGYLVAHGALHDLVANPNYLGEVVEWVGFAIATWSLAGTAFALYTAANLVPRAVSNRAWLRRNVPGYPATRRAIFPWIL